MKLKSFEVDVESIDDIKKHIHFLKSYLGAMGQRSTRRVRLKETFNAALNIFNTDISSIYDGVYDESREYYVYAHCDAGRKIVIDKEGVCTFAATLGIECVPFYVGKGTGNRAFSLKRSEVHRKTIQRIHDLSDSEVDVKIIKDGLTEKEALMLEAKLIDILGLKHLRGKLVNLDEGYRANDRRQLYIDDLCTIHSSYNKFR